MQTYELTYIISSHLASQDADSTQKDVEAFLQSKEGAIVKSEKSAPQPLAYPIKKHSSGFYVVTEFNLPEGSVKEFKEHLQKNPHILRHFLIVKKPIKIMKERRTRKPLAAMPETPAAKTATPAKKIEMADINKKLDEILSE